MSFWSELRRRNVFKVGAAYLIVAWLLIQVLVAVEGPLSLPAGIDTAVIVLLALGFPVALLLAWAYELTPSGIKPSTAVSDAESITHVTGQRLNYVVTALLAVAVAFLGFDRFVLNRASSAGAEMAAERPVANGGGEAGDAAAPVSSLSVAVLPFDNLSADPDQDYFADGISLELRDQIQSATDIYVTPRDLVLPLKGSSDPPAALAASLGVANLLTGSIRKAGQTVRITAALTRAADNTELWSRTYDGSIDDILDFQGAIAGSVIEALTGSFDADATDVFAGGTQNDAAYDLYLRALATAVPNERKDLLGQALALDPDFALAQIALADISLFQATAVGVGAFAEPAAAAERAVQRAVALAPDLLGTRLLVARVNVEARQWLAAEQVYQDALEKTDGRDYDVNVAYGSFLLRVGKLTEAIPYLERARRQAPLLAGPGILLAMIYDALGDTGRADGLQRTAEPLFAAAPFTKFGPAFWRELYRENLDDARRLFAASGMTWPPQSVPGAGNEDDADFSNADQMLATAREAYEDPALQFAVAQQFVALFAANYGDVNLATAAWRKTLDSSTAYMIFFWTPTMAPVRSNPDFRDALRGAGFVDYWRQSGWPDQCSPVGADDFECH